AHAAHGRAAHGAFRNSRDPHPSATIERAHPRGAAKGPRGRGTHGRSPRGPHVGSRGINVPRFAHLGLATNSIGQYAVGWSMNEFNARNAFAQAQSARGSWLNVSCKKAQEQIELLSSQGLTKCAICFQQDFPPYLANISHVKIWLEERGFSVQYETDHL